MQVVSLDTPPWPAAMQVNDFGKVFRYPTNCVQEYTISGPMMLARHQLAKTAEALLAIGELQASLTLK